jgi:hypothetical protein
MNNNILVAPMVIILTLGCHGVAAAEDNPIYIGSMAPFTDSKSISQAILTECSLPERQAELIEEAAKSAGVPVVRSDEAVAQGKGRILKVEITSAMSGGNAFIGHHKQVSVKGVLLEDGNEIGSFSGTRSSMGGAFAGFKGSCSVLGRCVKALAEDVSLWLKNPEKASRIGE